MDVPKDKSYPPSAGQCDECGGHGCGTCGGKGWLVEGHPKIRRCLYGPCGKVISPAWVPVYCDNACAASDA